MRLVSCGKAVVNRMRGRHYIPTDLDLLEAIHSRYYPDFLAFDKEKPTRSAKIYVPIEITEVAQSLGQDAYSVLVRLQHDLNHRYEYRDDNGRKVAFFSRQVGKRDRECVNFPYLEAVLAKLRYENRKFKTATMIAVVSLVVSLMALVHTAINS